MTAHHQGAYEEGQKVWVEGVVTKTSNYPYGPVLVAFPLATDSNYLLDGIDGWHPAATVYGEGFSTTEVFDLTYFTAAEGIYQEDGK